MKFYQNKKEQGFISLISVLIVGAVGLTITISLISQGISSSKISFSLEKYKKAMTLAEICVEEGLLRVRNDKGFLGEESFSFDEGNCSYEIKENEEDELYVYAVGESGFIKKRLKVTINETEPRVIISSWSRINN